MVRRHTASRVNEGGKPYLYPFDKSFVLNECYGMRNWMADLSARTLLSDLTKYGRLELSW